jgi:hypothetical protein
VAAAFKKLSASVNHFLQNVSDYNPSTILLLLKSCMPRVTSGEIPVAEYITRMHYSERHGKVATMNIQMHQPEKMKLNVSHKNLC